MRSRTQHGFLPFLGTLVAILMTLSNTAHVTWAANHREAPITALDHKADITDWFAFVSYDDPTKVTLILDVDPLREPANGPNYFPFDPEILYEMKIDNDRDGKADIIFQFRFKTDVRLPGVFTALVGLDDGVNTPANSPPPLPPGTPLIPPAITALDGPGSQGLSLRQTYTVTMLASDGHLHSPDDPKAIIGTYGTTSRPRIKILSRTPGGTPLLSKNFVQMQRMGNALINELLIGTGDKDKFSMSEPADDVQFANYLLDPLLARVLNAAYGGAVPIPTPPRLDLAPLVLYAPPLCRVCTTPALQGPIADLLRLNTGIPPTPRANRKRLGVLAGDLAGYPNGRRVSDDVLDISARAVVGVLAGPLFDGFPNNRIGDGVNTNDVPYQEIFPYVAFANSGRNSQHQNPGSTGCFDSVAFTPVDCPTD